MRDFPVPEEFTMLACRAYMFSLTRYTEIVSRSTSAALPFPRIYGCCRSVNNTSDVRTTAYQDRTSQHRRMVEVIWLIQGVGFLEGKQVM